MTQPKISVVIPIYNVEVYLEQCLSSVVGQTYSNLEIICVDDGSTDRSGEILDRFAAEDDRIVVIHQPNGGVSAARNTALDRCTGDFIGFVDGDDWLEPDMYETLIGNIIADDIDISACGYFEDVGGQARPVRNLLPVPECPTDMREFLKYIYIRDKYRGVASYLWTRLFRRRFVVEEGLRFQPEISISEDQIFTAQCYVRARRSVYTAKTLYHYVQHAESAMHNILRRLDGLGSCAAFQTVIDLYEERDIDSAVIDYVKRFYVYHAYVLLQMAFQYNVADKIEPLKANIRKYFGVYCKTNREHPDRAEDVRQLLERVC